MLENLPCTNVHKCVHNRRFLEADLMIYVGQVVAHSWGGYTGTGAAIGLASTRSIASHHAHRVVNHPETTTGDQRRMYFRKLKADLAKVTRALARHEAASPFHLA